MRPTRFAEKELELICNRYFPYYHPVKKRWQIRKWDSLTRKRHPEINSKLVHTVYKVDDLGRDIGYREIDQSVIDDCREGFYNARNAKMFSLGIDRDNERIERAGEEEIEYVSRYMAKRIWHRYREPTIFLRG